MEIKNLDELLAPKLGLNKKIIDAEITKPPAKGFGSIMLKVKLTVQDQSNKRELVHLVAKKIPASEFAREIFNTQETFKKEVVFYDVILPTLAEFQKEAMYHRSSVVQRICCLDYSGLSNIMDNFAEFYGARYNLNGESEIVDEDAVLLLEDLSVKGMFVLV